MRWAVVVVLCIAALQLPSAMAEDKPSRVVPGMVAITFEVEQLNDVFFVLDEAPTVIWFFTPFCSYIGQVHSQMSRDCDNAVRRLKDAFGEYGEQFRWIGLSYMGGATRKNVTAYREENEIPFAVAIDVDGDVFADYGVRYSPTVIIVSGGKVVYRAKATLEDMEETLATLALPDAL